MTFKRELAKLNCKTPRPRGERRGEERRGEEEESSFDTI